MVICLLIVLGLRISFGLFCLVSGLLLLYVNCCCFTGGLIGWFTYWLLLLVCTC